ncbi:hypothetical protein B0H19DRAFT_1060380 [Mycena capillaripes]|nr:hypothetical protein B0H19DRAFT_1060380 [Mycena capillaripes]
MYHPLKAEIKHTRGMILLSNLLRNRSSSKDRMSYTGWMNETTSSVDFAGDGDFSSVDMLITTIGGGERANDMTDDFEAGLSRATAALKTRVDYGKYYKLVPLAAVTGAIVLQSGVPVPNQTEWHQPLHRPITAYNLKLASRLSRMIGSVRVLRDNVGSDTATPIHMNNATSSADFAGDGDFSSVDMLIITIGGVERATDMAGDLLSEVDP